MRQEITRTPGNTEEEACNELASFCDKFKVMPPAKNWNEFFFPEFLKGRTAVVIQTYTKERFLAMKVYSWREYPETIQDESKN